MYGLTFCTIRPYWYGKGRLAGIYVDLGWKVGKVSIDGNGMGHAYVLMIVVSAV